MQIETLEASSRLTRGTQSEQADHLGRHYAEPLYFSMDGALRYAKAYHKRFESKLCDDYALGPAWLNWVKGVRALLNGDGAVAMERGITTDSKDNGVIEEIFWRAMEVAGFTEADL